MVNVVLTKNLNPELLKLGKNENDKKCYFYYQIDGNEFEKLRIQTPKLKLCFDPKERMDKNGKPFVINVCFSMEPIGTDKNKNNIEEFEQKLKIIETKIKKLLPPELIASKSFNSNFYKKDDYPTVINASILCKNGDPTISISSDKDDSIMLSNLNRNDIICNVLRLESVWFTDTKFGINWVVESMKLYGNNKQNVAMMIDDDDDE